MRYSTRTLALAVAGIGVAFAVLRYANATSAVVVTGGSGVMLLVAAALAVGAAQPARSFWLGLLIVSLGARHLESDEPLLFEDFPPISARLADWLDDRLLPGTIPAAGTPNTTDYWLSDNGRRVYYVVRGETGEMGNRGVMSPSQAQKQGVNVAALPTIADTESFAILVREMLIAALGILGGVLAYAARRREHAPRPERP